MKYTILALATLALWTGSASAAPKHPHCTDLKANWQHAPHMQCPQIYVENRVEPTYSIPASEPEPETEVDVSDDLE